MSGYLGMQIGGEHTIPVRRSLDQVIHASELWPHFSDQRFQGSAKSVLLLPGVQTVQLGTHEEVECAGYTHLDRLMFQVSGWSGIEAEASRSVDGRKDTGRYFQEMLRLALEDPTIELVHILAGVNHSTGGYPYHVYGYNSSAVNSA